MGTRGKWFARLSIFHHLGGWCAFAALSCGALSAQARPSTKYLPLKEGAAPAPAQLPPGACLRLFVDRGPMTRPANQAALAELVADRVKRGNGTTIVVDREGTGERLVTVAMDKPQVVSWFMGGRFIPLLFFHRGRDWWVGSASVLEARQGETSLVLLDANADGDWLDPTDCLSWRGGAFRWMAGELTVNDGQLGQSFRIIPRGKVATLACTDLEARPPFADDNQWMAFTTLNAMRNTHGFPPAVLWEESSRGVTAHTKFLHLNNPDGKGKSPPGNMGEPEDMPHRTEEGHRFGSSGNVAMLTNPGQDSASHVASILLMTHSRAIAFTPRAARFGYGRTGMWSFFRLDEKENSTPGSLFSVLPGPGTNGVPRVCGGNWPPPKSFPSLYDNNRGLPISVALNVTEYQGTRFRVRSMALFSMPEMKEIPGFFFSNRDIFDGAPEHHFFYVPGEPLLPDSRYLAQATVEGAFGENGGMSTEFDLLQWEFQTGK